MLYSSLTFLFVTVFAAKPFPFLPAPCLQSPQSVWFCLHKSSHSATPPKQQPIPFPKPPTREFWMAQSRFPTHDPSKSIHPASHISKHSVTQHRQLSRTGCESGQDHRSRWFEPHLHQNFPDFFLPARLTLSLNFSSQPHTHPYTNTQTTNHKANT